MAALQAGKHVFVEKPMALTEAGADEIAAAAKKAGRIVFVGFMRRYAEAFLRVKGMIKSVKKGDISYGELCSPSTPPFPNCASPSPAPEGG